MTTRNLTDSTDLPGIIDAKITTHTADTTSVHGIADTSALATTSAVTSAIATHEADTTSVHGIADTSTLYRSGGTDVALADGGTGASTAANARTNLGLVIGTDVAPATSSLAAAASIDGSEVVPIVQTGADKTIDLQSIADLASPGGITIREADGSPSVANALNLVFPNGTLTDNGSSTVTYTPAAGGGAMTVGTRASRLASSPTAGTWWADTTLQRVLFYDGTVWRRTDVWLDADLSYATDNFTAANGTSLSGRTTDTGGLTWAAFNGSIGTIQSNAAAFGAGDVAGLNTNQTVYAVECDITAPSGSGLYIKHSGANNLFGISIKNDSGTWKWYKDNALVISTGIAYSAGQTIRLSTNGVTHVLTIGSSSHTYPDSSYASYTRIAAYTNITIDNFKLLST